LLSSKHPLLLEELKDQRPYLKSLGRYGAKQIEILERALTLLKHS
jgi:hypothetical protein